ADRFSRHQSLRQIRHWKVPSVQAVAVNSGLGTRDELRFLRPCRRCALHILSVYMSKPATLSEEAYSRLVANKKHKRDSLSQVILRFVPPPIRTFGDLERHLNNLEGPVV